MADPANPFLGELAALGLAALPVITLQLRTWYIQRRDKLELEERNKKIEKQIKQTNTQVISNANLIDEQARKSEIVDSEMRQFILQIARESESRIRDGEVRIHEMEVKLVHMAKENELAVGREREALKKVDELKEELAIAKFQIGVLTERIFELENQLGIPHSLPKSFAESVVKPS